jgi:hypothetical protein
VPGLGLMLKLERRTEEVMQEFSALHISNTLWGLAKLGIMMVQRVMALIEQRVEHISAQSDPQASFYCMRPHATSV